MSALVMTPPPPPPPCADDQIVQKKMTQDPHLQRQGREQGHTSILIGSVYQDPSPPKAGHFGRGAGPFVDKYVLEERETKKAKENEHYVSAFSSMCVWCVCVYV